MENQYCGNGLYCNSDQDPRYGNFTTFKEASDACGNNESCKMIMDRGCDENGPFELCKSTSLCVSNEGTCSYKKLVNGQGRSSGINHYSFLAHKSVLNYN